MIFSCFTQKLKEKVGGLLGGGGGGGGGKGYVAPPSQILGGAGPPGPPSSHAYGSILGVTGNVDSLVSLDVLTS